MIGDRRLSSRARSLIRRAEALDVHPISCWEVGMLVLHRRLRLRQSLDDWIEIALGRPKIALLPFTPKAAVRGAGFGAGFPGDPADRFIAAAALETGAPLVTADERIAGWGGSKSSGESRDSAESQTALRCKPQSEAQ